MADNKAVLYGLVGVVVVVLLIVIYKKMQDKKQPSHHHPHHLSPAPVQQWSSGFCQALVQALNSTPVDQQQVLYLFASAGYSAQEFMTIPLPGAPASLDLQKLSNAMASRCPSY